jgi:phage terminase Nu1 subunit (DNA packaging protein)
MTQVSLTTLSELTGRTWRTCRGRLQAAGVEPVGRDGRSDLYESADALPAIYEVERVAPDELDLTVERARLAKAQADKTEIENAVRCGELTQTSRIVGWYSSMVANAKNRLLQIPPTVGQQLDPALAPRVVELVRKLVHEALLELSQGEAGKGKR